MRVYLVRHGIAFDQDPARWPDDRARPLTDRGERAFKKAARGLREVAGDVEAVLSSPYARAWQTAEILERKARWPAPVALEALQVGQTPDQVVEALRPYAGAAALALVGHEPHLSTLAAYLLYADEHLAPFQLRKGGVARLDFEHGPARGAGRLIWLLTPAQLRALG